MLLVEDDKLLAQSLVLALRAEGIQAEQAPLTSNDAILEAIRATPYDLVLVDTDLGPPLAPSLHLIETLRESGARVVALTDATGRKGPGESVALGGLGVVSKHQGLEQLLAALRTP